MSRYVSVDVDVEEVSGDAALMSEAEIAKLWGVTRTAVWQVKRRALSKLRAAIVADPVLREIAAEACGVEIPRA
jgi:hypothetical protein